MNVEELDNYYNLYQEYINKMHSYEYFDDEKLTSFGYFVKYYTEHYEKYIEYMDAMSMYGRIATDEYMSFKDFSEE